MTRICLAFLAPVLCAQVIPGRYIVELAGEPATFAARARVRAEHARVRPRLERIGARVIAGVETVANALIVEIPDVNAAQLQSLAGVRRVHPVRLVRPSLDHALSLHRIPEALAALGGTGNAGAGIKIAIIDSGIAQDHTGFQDPSLPMPPGFPRANQNRDLAYTNNKVIVARNYAASATPQDSFGHGTAVAMEAAGVANSGPLGVIAGVAPKAWLGNYKVYQNENPFGEDTVLQAIEDALNDGMDVINLSLGIAVAERIADDVLVAAVERASALGVVVSVAAGNNGSTPNTIASPATAPSVIAVGATSNDRAFAPAAVRLGGSGGYFAMPGTYSLSSSSLVTAPLMDIAAIDPTGEACAPLPSNSLTGNIALIVRSPHSGRPCSFVVKLSNAQNAGAIGAIVYMNPDSPNVVTMDLRGTTLSAVSVDYPSGADIKKRLRDNPAATGTIQLTTSALPRNPNVMAPFSSRGPNVNSAIKPDVVATGMFLYTATQNTNPSSFLYGATGYVKEADGTSFAAPLVAGAAALLKAARPGLTAAQYRSLLVNSAAPVISDEGSPYSVQLAGAGNLNVKAAIESTVAVSPVSLGFGTGSGTTDLTRAVTITNLGTVDDTFTISLAPGGAGPSLSVSSNTVRIGAGASQELSVHLTGQSLSPGEYQGYLRIQSTQTTVNTILPYWFGVADGVPKYVADLQRPGTASAGSVQDIYFRVTDAAGAPVSVVTPAVKAIGGIGSVLRVTSEDAQSPGVFRAVVQLAVDDGANVFEIGVGAVRKQITIVGLTQ
jgi:subtilisin family serine protease